MTVREKRAWCMNWRMKRVKVGQSDTQEETSGGSDSETSHDSEKGHK